jgi:uncharacterized protein (DUF1810 family)
VIDRSHDTNGSDRTDSTVSSGDGQPEDPHRLQRFVDAQDSGGTYPRAVSELRRGRKQSHWMWFVFPQIAGLGSSPMAQEFAISGLPEARAYLEHPVLGARLLACAGIVAEITDSSAADIFGWTDAQKLHSSMTLFARAAPRQAIFGQVLDRYFDGREDDGTTDRL